MMNGQVIKSEYGDWMNWVKLLLQHRPNFVKTHDYTKLVHGVDYVFETVCDDPQKGYMTAQKRGVKCGDRILLLKENKIEQYRIQELNYYSSPSDVWIALLVKLEK